MAMVVVLGEVKHSFEEKDSLAKVAAQINNRVCAVLDCQGQYRKIVCLIADKDVIRFFFFDGSVFPGPFTSSPVLPFLSQGSSPSIGFTLFFRMCNTAPGKLHYPEPPICPVPNGQAYVIRLRGEPKANVFHFKRPDGTEGVVKVYKPGNSVSLAAFYQEKNALEKFNAKKAPVPTLLEGDPIHCYLLLSPYATTLGEVNEYSREIACAVAHAAAEFFQAARDLNFVHKDISPDNILVCQDQGKVLINDLGSCQETQLVTDTSGATLLYCCPFFGTHFELGQRRPYLYTLHNDMRALFICLFLFSIPSRTAGKEVLQKKLPWQHAWQAMQSHKQAFMMSNMWKDLVVPEAVQLLEGLWEEMFVNSRYDEVDQTHVFDLDKVLAILEGLGKEPGKSPHAK
jgi:serine/threonine protein kinase